MSRFRSPQENENSTLAQARAHMEMRSQLRLPALGIVAIATGAQDIIDEVDFAANGIGPADLVNLQIRTSRGRAAGPDHEMPGFGSYVNVAQELRTITSAPDTETALARLIAMEKPGVTAGEVAATIDNIPAVSTAKKAALKKWAKSMEPPPDPGPQGKREAEPQPDPGPQG